MEYTTLKNGNTLKENRTVVNDHIESLINSEDGVHGIRYYEEILSYWDDNKDEWVELQTGVDEDEDPVTEFGVEIDLTNSNPNTCCEYIEGATGYKAGNSAWDKIFGFKPCLFKNGSVVDYLNPDDFTKFENGSSADITSGDSGDVMIEFPRLGFKFETDSNTLTIRLTTESDKDDYTYYAHTRGTTKKDYFYISAYECCLIDGKLRSISGQTPYTYDTLPLMRGYAQANASGYEVMAYYQLLFIQILYIFKYRSLNSQTSVGMGNVGTEVVDGGVFETTVLNSGTADKNGMDFGVTTGATAVKIFGLENLWGNIRTWVEGITTSLSLSVSIGNDNFSSTSSYENVGSITWTNGSYITKVWGTAKLGFIPTTFSGSSSTYFCDLVNITASRVGTFGGASGSINEAGIFKLDLNTVSTSRGTELGARMMYL